MGIFKHMQAEIELREKREGITAADLLDLPTQLRRLVNRITREGELTLEVAAEHIGESLAQTSQKLDALVEKGYLRYEKLENPPVYRTRFARRRGREIPAGIWAALEKRCWDGEDVKGE